MRSTYKFRRHYSKKNLRKKNSKLPFFESLLPHVDKFDDNHWLQCQIEFLQVISKIKNAYPCIPKIHNVNNHPTSQIRQFNQPSKLQFTQLVNVSHISQQALASHMLSPQFTGTPVPAHQMACSPFTNLSSRSPSVASLSSSNTIDFTEL